MSEFIEIGDIEPKIQFTSSAGQTLFSYPFIAFADGDLTVYVNDDISTDYTVSNLYPEEGGSITFNTGLANGDIVTILRDTPFEKTTGWVTGGDFKATTLDNQNAKFIAMVQQNERDIGSAVKTSPTAPAGLDITFPNPEDGLFPVWDGNSGNMVNSSESADQIISTTLEYRDDAEEAAIDAIAAADIATAAVADLVVPAMTWLSGDGVTTSFNLVDATSDNTDAYDVLVDGVTLRPNVDFEVVEISGVITLNFLGDAPSNRTENIIVKGRIATAIEIPVGDIPFIEITETGDDKGVRITEQFSVGQAGDGREAVFGEGDSYGVGKENVAPNEAPELGSAWHCDIANTTDLVITGATDVTVELSSDGGSTTGLFGGTTEGKYILVGSEVPFGGVKVKIDTLGAVESDNIAGEYLRNDTPTWTSVPYMVTDANYPYEQKALEIASCSSCSEQWRFGFNPLELPVVWELATLNINGTDYTKYWARFRISEAAGITTDPSIEQIKLHTNRYEINADGNTEYFGRGRYTGSIELHQEINDVKDPKDADVPIAVGIVEKRKKNKFENGADDGFVLSGLIPEGMDTSVPVVLEVDWFASDDAVGNVELQMETINIGDDFIYDGTGTKVVQTPSIITVDTDSGKLQRSIFVIDVSKALPGDKFYASLFRDASATRVNDTYTGDIITTGYGIVAYYWRP